MICHACLGGSKQGKQHSSGGKKKQIVKGKTYKALAWRTTQNYHLIHQMAPRPQPFSGPSDHHLLPGASELDPALAGGGKRSSSKACFFQKITPWNPPKRSPTKRKTMTPQVYPLRLLLHLRCTGVFWGDCLSGGTKGP